MELLRSWLIGICAVSILSAVICAIAPKNAVFGNVKMICALILVVAMIAPLKKLDISEFRVISHRIENDTNEKTENIMRENQKIKQDIIADTLSAYILNRALQNEDEIKAFVKCEGDIPQSVTIVSENGKVSNRTIKMIEQECGISKDRIVIKKSED